MAELWYPNPGVTEAQHERLMGGASTSGVFGHPSDTPLVYAPNSGTREVRVRAVRRAIVEGYGWENGASEIVLPSLSANGTGSTRVDLVVLRLDRTDWSVRVKVVQGTAGNGAPALTNTDSGVWELPLAEVAVASGATTLAGSTVTNRAWYVGPDGSLRCTATIRPPHAAGRVVWEHPTGRYLVSDGTEWLLGVEDSGAVTVSVASGWTTTVNQVRRRNGSVFMALSPRRTGGTVAGGATVTVGTLPAGFRPAAPFAPFNGVIFTGSDYGGYFTIGVNGVVSAVFNGPVLTNRAAIFQAVAFPAA